MVLVKCVKLDGVRWAGSREYTACSTRFDKVFRVCVDIAHPPHRGRCVMSTTSIVHTSVSCVNSHHRGRVCSSCHVNHFKCPYL